MTSLGDKAAESPEVSLAKQSAPGLYRLNADGEDIEDIDLVPADELTPEGEFPQYGDFLEVGVPSDTGTENPSFDQTEYIEVPGALAAWLVEEAEPGAVFRIRQVVKIDGEFDYDIELVGGPETEAADLM